MAFNPFSGFAKYKKIWLGAVMILVMITFVLCSGQKGDMGDVLLRVFRFGGTPVVSFGGTRFFGWFGGATYYRQDFDQLVRQRKVANDYMRRYSSLLAEVINDRIRALGESKEEGAKELRGQLGTIRQILNARLREPKYFVTGTKADDLIDFQVWLAEADRLRVDLSDRRVVQMVDEELYLPILRNAFNNNLAEIAAKAMQEVRSTHGYDMVSPEFVVKALKNEFRVRIAKLADSEMQVRSLSGEIEKRLKPSPFMPATLVRTPISPGQLWDFYQDNRKEFDVTLMPMPVSAFVAEVGEPEPQQLTDIFEKYKKNAFDPASDQPGFKKPQLIRVQYVSADKNSPHFKRIAQTVDLMGQYPIGSLVPQMPLATALTFASGPAAFDLLLEQDYLTKVEKELRARRDYIGGSNLALDPGQATAAFLGSRNPIAIASMIGASLRPDAPFAAVPAFLAVPYTKNLDQIKLARKEEARVLTPWFATVVASGTMPTGLVPYFQLETLGNYPTRDLQMTRPLPLAVVRDDIVKSFDERMGQTFVSANMAFIKKKLEDEVAAGKSLQVQRLLDRYGPTKPGQPPREGDFRDLGLEIAQTDRFYDRFTIKDAPELKPLFEAYKAAYLTVNALEGRDIRPETKLGDEDFWKLFFDSSESFSAARDKYHAKPWPPIIKLGTTDQIEQTLKQSPSFDADPRIIEDGFRKAQNREANKEIAFDLFGKSERPFLFWRTEEKTAEVPESLAEVKDQVVQAWKAQKARELKVLPYAKKIADGLLVGNSDYTSVLRQDPKFGKDIITIDGLAPIYFDREHFGAGKYGDYTLKRGLIDFPRDDVVKQLLSLNGLSSPIKIDVADIDRLNEELFRDAQGKNLAGDRYIQVLTNRPRTVYYLAVVKAARAANQTEFLSRVLPGAAADRDFLFDVAAQRSSEEHYRALVQQLRKNHRVTVHDAAKSFDTDGGS